MEKQQKGGDSWRAFKTGFARTRQKVSNNNNNITIYKSK